MMKQANPKRSMAILPLLPQAAGQGEPEAGIGMVGVGAEEAAHVCPLTTCTPAWRVMGNLRRERPPPR